MALLGAGGAARAIAVELALAGVSALSISNRDAERAAGLAELLTTRLPPDVRSGLSVEVLRWTGRHEVAGAPDIVINCTSIGLYPDRARPELDFDRVPAAATVCDVIPNPPDTAFLAAARARGCRVVDGLEMLVRQGALSVAYWCGERPDLGVMRRALAEAFGGAGL